MQFDAAFDNTKTKGFEHLSSLQDRMKNTKSDFSYAWINSCECECTHYDDSSNAALHVSSTHAMCFRNVYTCIQQTNETRTRRII
jgi:hypothetical protein